MKILVVSPSLETCDYVERIIQRLRRQQKLDPLHQPHLSQSASSKVVISQQPLTRSKSVKIGRKA